MAKFDLNPSEIRAKILHIWTESNLIGPRWINQKLNLCRKFFPHLTLVYLVGSAQKYSKRFGPKIKVDHALLQKNMLGMLI